MKKKIILIAGVLILLLIGGFFMMKKGPKTVVAPEATQEQAASPSSLKDLISKGIAQSCTFSNEGSTGTVYVSGGKVRGDFDTTVDGKVTKSHMIVDANTSYIWSDGQASGIKMTFDASATPSAEGATSPGGFDASANMNYKCGVWVTDSSMFTLPTGVKFMTFAATVPGASPASGSSSSQCSYCDSLSGDSKTQCLTALKCK
ncbi:MAG: hypothetical protein NTZ07_02355 [Candidatus Woesebacteria bacterium]|nr:hypothetical protein [Candidatus Woesebacteria bacterium]